MKKQTKIAEWAVGVALIAALPLIVVGKVVGDKHGLVTASWYGEKYRGKPTASGELFDPDKLTAAHRRLPFGTRVKCTLGSRFVIVTITDRGPFVKGRTIDLSRRAFSQLAHTDAGLIQIKMEVLR
jgi:rare lipoprotein A